MQGIADAKKRKKGGQGKEKRGTKKGGGKCGDGANGRRRDKWEQTKKTKDAPYAEGNGKRGEIR